jgi:spore coat polysaccharide biosynthesis protein SpsF (cytidylyltransferase family)
MGSTRFPGKVLAPLQDEPVIAHVLHACDMIDLQAVVGMPNCDAAGPLGAYLTAIGVRHFAPNVPPEDVLARYHDIAFKKLGPEYTTIVRLTADCPLVDPNWINHLLREFKTGEYDYMGVTNDPDGNDVEIFSRHALDRAYDEAYSVYDREHVTPWMREHLLSPVWNGNGATDVKYSVDTVEDLAVCEYLLDQRGVGDSWQNLVAAFRRRTHK